MPREEVDIIRSVHRNLHQKVEDGESFESVWSEHLNDEISRNKYAAAMSSLGLNIWPESESEDRILLCHSVIQNYFLGRGQVLIEKDLKFSGSPDSFSLPNKTGERLRLLDVGSSFNPFKRFEDFYDIIPIDISPASPEVLKCDFTAVEVLDRRKSSDWSVINGNLVTGFFSQSTDVVVFCLLLEYIPCPLVRLKTVAKAGSLLKEGGLLLIITPDSNTQHRSFRMIRQVIAVIEGGAEGCFLRKFFYKKAQHFHCIAFRKTVANVPFSNQTRSYLKEIGAKDETYFCSALAQNGLFLGLDHKF